MSSRSRPEPVSAAGLEEVAAASRRLAVLLAAGLAPRLAAAHAGGDPERDDGAWGLLAATWALAIGFGAPLAATLHRFADGLAASAALRRELDVAFSGPAATARLVGMLPVVGLLFGLGLGFDTVHVLFATAPGWACLAVGIALMIASRRWSAAMIRAASPRELMPGLAIELVAIGLTAGVSVDRARSAAGIELARCAPERNADAAAAEDAAMTAVLTLAVSAGVPAVALLRAEADRLRVDAQARGHAAAAAVAVRLMLPLALCVLPAFMLLGVVPVLLALFSSTGLVAG